MRKHKNHFKKQRNRIGDVNYSGNMPFEEKLIVKCIRAAEKIIIAVSIVLAIILFIIVKCNEFNNYLWFDQKDALILNLFAVLLMFICSPIAFILEIIAERLD